MDSSLLETLRSFDYVLTIILNNVWTCMAILTAGAISFIWSTTLNKSSSPRFEQASSSSVSCHEESNVVHSYSPQLFEPVSKNAISTRVLECTEIKKGKFAVYYYDDEVPEEDCYGGNVECEETEYDDVSDGGSVTFCCRELNLGWYRYLDLTVFNGNVVRFWD